MYIDYMKSEYYIDSTFGLFGKHFAHRELIQTSGRVEKNTIKPLPNH